MRTQCKILGISFLILGVFLPSISGSLYAQTAEERERAEQLRKREQEVRQELEFRLQEIQEERLARMEAVLAQAMAQLEHAQFQGEEASAQRDFVAQRMRAQAEAMAQMEESRRQVMDQEKKIRQMVVSIRNRVRLGVTLDGTQGPEYDRQGARLQGVMEDTPAEAAGLREGDIITHLDGHRLTEPIPGEADEDFGEGESLPVQRLMSVAGDLEAGDQVEIRYLREGTPATVTLEAAEIEGPSVMVLGGERGEEGVPRVLRVDPGGEGIWTLRLPDDELVELKMSELEGLEALEDLKLDMEDFHADRPRIRIMPDPEELMEGYAYRGEGGAPFVFNVLERRMTQGLRMTEMNPGLAEYFSTDAGVLVLEVDEGATLGLQAGDVILSIDGREVDERRDVARILRSYEEGEAVSFSVIRKGREVDVQGTIG